VRFRTLVLLTHPCPLSETLRVGSSFDVECLWEELTVALGLPAREYSPVACPSAKLLSFYHYPHSFLWCFFYSRSIYVDPQLPRPCMCMGVWRFHE